MAGLIIIYPKLYFIYLRGTIVYEIPELYLEDLFI